MPQNTPQEIIIVHDDGSKASASFCALPAHLQAEIMRQPFVAKSSLTPDKERFVIFEWDDGWKEVYEVDNSCTEINRYYVISRPEDVGRLSLNRNNGLPELIEINRKPFNIRKITMVDTFQLKPERSMREGKKTDHFYSLKEEKNSISKLKIEFEEALAKENIARKDLEKMDFEQAQEQYEKIRKRMGLRAGQRQQDVYDFLAYLLKKR